MKMEKIKKWIWPILLTMSLIFTILNFVSCEDDSLSRLCDLCKSDADCMDGLKCLEFTGNYTLCATSSTTTCKDPLSLY